MESNLTENKIDNFETHKLCPLCNKVRKFKVIIKPKGKQLSGRKCLACVSAKNNEKLKSKNYYKIYYQQHAEELKQKDKERYKKRKEETNVVKFGFDDDIIIQPIPFVE